jgi:predicted alpha/beta-hydrolase family hydrolase
MPIEQPPTLWTPAVTQRAVLLLGHGAGSPMTTPFLSSFAAAIAGAGVSVLRFDFPYMTAGRKAPDRAPVLVECTRRAFELARRRAGDQPVLAGGRSMGGRIASMATAEGMPAAGLVFLAYPLHPPGRPEKIRDAHLYGIRVPMLFLQGTRDPFAQPELLSAVLDRLGDRAEYAPVDGGDHAFRVAGGERDAARIGASLAPVAADFIQRRILRLPA